MRQFRAANPLYFKQWRLNNLEKSKEYRRKSDAKHKDKRRAALDEWRRKNPNRVMAQRLKWRESHREASRLRTIRWRSKNPSKCREYGRLKRLRRRGVEIKGAADILSWTERWRNRRRVICYWCGGFFHPDDCHTDHIIALANGGPHEIGNLCISCGVCNMKKNAKPLSRWNCELINPTLL